MLGTEPSHLVCYDLDARPITAFLGELQVQRRIWARSRTLHLTAIRSFFSYATFKLPERAKPIQPIIATQKLRKKTNKMG